MKNPVTAILLASGYSRRLGADKLLLDLGGRTVIEHTMETISSCPFAKKLLISRQDVFSSLADKYGFEIHLNPLAKTGQAASIHLGVTHALPQAALMFFVGDQPLLSSGIITELLEEHQSHPGDIILPTVNGENKNPVIFPADLSCELLKTAGDEGGRSIIRAYPQRVRRVVFSDGIPFSDIDTKEDYVAILATFSQKN